MAKKKKSKKEKQSVAVNKDAAISRFRNRIMSDETVKYIYSEKESILHDKHCLYAKEIPDSDLFYEKQYLPSMKQCPKCALRAYISYRPYRKAPERYRRKCRWAAESAGRPAKAGRARSGFPRKSVHI